MSPRGTWGPSKTPNSDTFHIAWYLWGKYRKIILCLFLWLGIPQRNCVTKILPNVRVNFLVRFASKPLFCWISDRYPPRTVQKILWWNFWLCGSFLAPDMGYRTIIARYVAQWGIAKMCLCKTKCQGEASHHLGDMLLRARKPWIRRVPTTPDPNTSEKVSRYKWEAYRDTNWWCIYYFLPRGGHTFAKVCHRNGRCIAILFKSIGVRGCFDFPEWSANCELKHSGIFEAESA